MNRTHAPVQVPAQPRHVGDHLRQWRQRRRLSQLDLALDAEISARHLSFMETGRASPSRDMLMRLAERLDVPLRERNVLLVAGGFAPAFPQRPLDDPAMAAAHEAIACVLKAHEPNPALAVDRHWTLVAANATVARLLEGIAPHLLQGAPNVLRLSLHPDGLAPRTVNFPEWRAHMLERLQRQCEATADAKLVALHAELTSYPAPARAAPMPKAFDAVVVPFRLRHGDGVLSFLSTTMVFGTPLDITLSELAVEAFFPADEATKAMLRAMAAA
jgi:transcriptional regulator with XRE-family HTH domain